MDRDEYLGVLVDALENNCACDGRAARGAAQGGSLVDALRI